MAIRALLILLAMAVAAATAQTWRLHSLRTTVAEEKAAQAEFDRLTERRAALRNQEIDRATQTRIQATRAAADGARSDAERLRNALAAVSQRTTTTTTGCADEHSTIDRLAGLLAEGAALVAECTRIGGSLAVQVEGLQDGHDH